ncbi:MAG: triose-phosphate isomerase [Dethiobacter sp.]|jgi:triosephosphate isomerase|nr:MAG: triose-phosphate isomerase [Dethiobacter sp.]
MRQTLIVANWKMYKTLAEAEEFMERFTGEIAGVSGIETVICAPFISLARLSVLMERTTLLLGAQNMHWQKEGAFTGEISPLMLRDLGIKYVIIGHSERRLHFNESNLLIKRKVASAFNFGLIPILCVGENWEQHSSQETEKVIKEQLFSALEGFTLENEFMTKMVLAYEPVWAIGTGTAARGEEANAVAGFMRSLLQEKWGGISEKVRILYGGSVNADNITEFTGKEDLDGALVGGSSLNVETFAGLLKAVFNERRA